MLVSGNVMIDYEHIEAAGNAIIPRDAKFEGERFEGFRDVAREAKRYGSLLVAQVSHPGRQVPDTMQEHPISASDIHLKGMHIHSRRKFIWWVADMPTVIRNRHGPRFDVR